MVHIWEGALRVAFWLAGVMLLGWFGYSIDGEVPQG
jgi:hypothetical protein